MNDTVSLSLTEISEDGDDISDILPSTSRTPEEDIIRSQKIELLRQIIEKLKPTYRKLIELRYYEEKSYEEIAVELDLPIGTVKAKLFRAREFLYHLLNDRHEKIHED